MTTTVNLGAALEQTLDDLVSHGRYGSRSEVLREGVRLVEEREQQFQKLKRDLMDALEHVAIHGSIPAEEVRASLTAKYRAMAAERA